MASIDYTQEIKLAQKNILKASQELSSAKMRLEETQYSSDMNRIWKDIAELNNKLIAAIRR